MVHLVHFILHSFLESVTLANVWYFLTLPIKYLNLNIITFKGGSSLNHAKNSSKTFLISADTMTTQLHSTYNEIIIRISLKDSNKKVIIKTHLTSASIKWFYFAICQTLHFSPEFLSRTILNLGWNKCAIIYSRIYEKLHDDNEKLARFDIFVLYF